MINKNCLKACKPELGQNLVGSRENLKIGMTVNFTIISMFSIPFDYFPEEFQQQT